LALVHVLEGLGLGLVTAVLGLGLGLRSQVLANITGSQAPCWSGATLQQERGGDEKKGRAVPSSRTRTQFGRRSFHATAPVVWNWFPPWTVEKWVKDPPVHHHHHFYSPVSANKHLKKNMSGCQNRQEPNKAGHLLQVVRYSYCTG